MRVFLYIRVSSEEQARHGHSLAAQETALKEWAKDHDIVGIYRDEGISGRKPYTKRPEMVRLLEDIEVLRPELIIFTKLDRWFRNIKEYYKVQEILDAHKVQWKAIHEDYDTTTSSGRLHVNIMLSVAQDEADRTSERIRAVQADLVSKGRPISGSVPLGFKIEKIDGVKRIVKNEQDKEEVMDIIQHYQTNQCLQATHLYINQKYGRSRPKIFIKKLLRNPLLYGSYNGNNSFTEGYITQDDFNAIQAALAKNIRMRRTNRIYLFTGLCRCPSCGNNLAGVNDRHGVNRYRCRLHIERRCDQMHSLSERKIEKYLKENILQAFKDYKIDVMKKHKKKKRESPAKYEAQLSRLNETYILGNLTQEYYTTKSKELKAKISELSAKTPDIIQTHECILNDNFVSLYDSLDQSAKRSLWRQLISQIVFDDNLQPVGVVFR